MKSTRALVMIMLAGLCVLSWVHLVTGVAGNSSRIHELVGQAEAYRDRKLYELSAEQYREAIKIQESKQLYENLLAVSEEYYAEVHTSAVRSTVVSAYDEATSAYPKETAFWEGYAQLYMESNDKSGAVKVLQSARNNHVSSDGLNALWNEAYYAVQTRYERYENLLTDGDSGFLAKSEGLWGALDQEGSQVLDIQYVFVGPAGENGERLCISDEGESFLFDKDGKMIGRFTADITDSRAYGSGLIPVKLSGREDWCYLNEYGEEQFGGFLQAGMFQSGKAAVQMDNGSWCLIGTDGQQSSKNTWQEVRLLESGAYLSDGRVLLKTNGVWGIYDSGGKEKGNLNAEDIDAYRGELIAFQKDGKWGFADDKGNIVISPSFDEARSFSGGVGAVRSGELWGFVSEDGNLALPCQFEDAAYFNDSGYCPVCPADETEQWQLISWQVNH